MSDAVLRSNLIRLASTLSVGSSERQALLDVLSAQPKTGYSAKYLLRQAWLDEDDGEGTLSMELEVPIYSVVKPGQTWPGGQAVGGLLDSLYEGVQFAMNRWVKDFENLGKTNGATFATVRLRESWTKLDVKGKDLIIRSEWGFGATFSNHPRTFWDDQAIRPMFEAVCREHGFKTI